MTEADKTEKIYRFSILEEIYRLHYYVHDRDQFEQLSKPLIRSLTEEEPESIPALGRFLADLHPSQVQEEEMFLQSDDIMISKQPRFMQVKFHSTHFFKLIYVYQGECTVDFRFTQLPMQTGDLVIMAPGVEHCSSMLKTGGIVFHLMVKQTTFETAFFSLLDKDDMISSFFRNAVYHDTYTNIPLYHTSGTPLVATCISEMYFESMTPGPYNNRILSSYFELLIAYLLKHCKQDFILLDNEKERVETDVPQVLRYIREQYATATLSEAAKTLNYSPAYLSRQVKRATGRNFVSLVKEQKLMHARLMLADTDATLDEIAEQVGYSDGGHFSRVFKAEFGMTPKAYRQMNRV